MKRQVQETGVRKYFGDDLVELQKEPLRALDAFFAECGPCIIEGCGVVKNAAGTYDVACGMVALEAEDTDGALRVMVMPFDGAASVSMPLYLSAGKQPVVRAYGDGKSKPVAYDYRAVASGVAPAAGISHLKLTASGGVRFTDAVQDALHRFITDAERSAWNGKETTGGSQVKADKALQSAKTYADGLKAAADEALAGHGADTVKHVTAAERSAWNGKAPSTAATATAAGLMSAADKAKLDGVEAGANSYAHPTAHPASMITTNASRQFVTATEKNSWNAKETPEGAQAKALAAEDAAVRDAVLHRQVTGAQMGEGLFKSSDSRLIPLGKPHTTLLLFTTPSARPASGSVTLYGEGLSGNVGYGMCVAYTAGGNVKVGMRGVTVGQQSIATNTLCCVGMSYEGSERCVASINGATTVMENVTYTYDHRPEIFLLGGSEMSAENGSLPDFRMIACRRLNFAMSAQQLSEAWNGGHPEFWRLPDALKNVTASRFPADNFTPSLRTWVQNGTITIRTDEVAAANGFSGEFQRFTNPEPGALSAYNAWRINNPSTEMTRYQLVEFEYRCDSELRIIHGPTAYPSFPANTGQARKASYIAKAGEYTSVSLAGKTATFLEIRTLRIESVECVLDLVPAGLFGGVWRDVSGKGIDVPYVPAGNAPAEVELAYLTEGYNPTGQDDRKEMLEYANYFTALRGELLQRQADEALERVRTYAATKANAQHSHREITPALKPGGINAPVTDVSIHFNSNVGLKVAPFGTTTIFDDVLWVNGWHGYSSTSGQCHALHFPRNANEMYMTMQNPNANAFGTQRVKFYHSGNIYFAPTATTSLAGLMSVSDKKKLNSIDTDEIMKILGAGVVNSIGSFQKFKGVVTSVDHRGTGYYRVSHKIGSTNYEVQATCRECATSNGYISIRTKAAGYFEVWTSQGNTAKDTSFFFQIFEF